MSGPKISLYTLSGRTREIFLEQTGCLRQSYIYMESIKSLIEEVNALQSSLGDIRVRMRFIAEQTGKGGDLLEELERQSQQAARMLSETRFRLPLAISTTISPRDLTESALAKRTQTLASLQTTLQETNACVTGFQRAVDACRNHSREFTDQLYQAFIGGVEDNTGNHEGPLNSNDPFSGVDFSVTVPEPGGTRGDRQAFEKLAAEISTDLQEMQREESLSGGYKAELESACKKLESICDNQRLRDFHSITVHPLIRRCADSLRIYHEQMEEYRGLRSHYLALCGLLQESAVDIPFGESAVQELRERIAACEKKLVMEKEQEYIGACIDEVMAEMGYDLIGNRKVTKKSGKRFRNEMYTFSEGTAVNITYASDGQIAMEIGGLDHTDRIPSPEEADQLCSEMEAFCGNFAEIEKRLAKKDIFVQNRISISPPLPQYAAILNLDDYTVTTDKTISNFPPATRKRDGNRQKIMRRDDE